MRSYLFYEKVDLLRIKAHLTHSFRNILQLYCVLVRTQPQQLLVGNIHMEIIRRYLTEAAKPHLKSDLNLGRESTQHFIGREVYAMQRHLHRLLSINIYRKHHLNRSRHKFHSPPGK